MPSDENPMSGNVSISGGNSAFVDSTVVEDTAADADAIAEESDAENATSEATSVAEVTDEQPVLSYRAHVSNIGWQSWQSGQAGTTGCSLAMEAVQLRLTGDVSQTYDIWYRVHVKNLGWLGWASNGDTAGTTGKSLSVEAVQIVMTKKGERPAGYNASQAAYVGASESLSVSGYTLSGSKVSVSGSDVITIGQAGSTGLSGIALSVKNALITGGIEYRTQRQFGTWQQNWTAGGSTSGSTSDGEQIQAV